MKKNKGFTLIELLAVIIILAVIALIATPIVLNVVNNAKESARQSSIAGYADAFKLARNELMLQQNTDNPDISDLQIQYQGDRVYCQTAGYHKDHGVVLDYCTINGKDDQYFYVDGKVYKDRPSNMNEILLDSQKTAINLISFFKSTIDDSVDWGWKYDQNSKEYYYKSRNIETRNLVYFGGKTWYALSFNEENRTIKLMATDQIQYKSSIASWNNNQQKYEESDLNKFLNVSDDSFYNSFSELAKSKIIKSDYCIGTYDNNCSIKTNQNVGLLTEDEYKKMSYYNLPYEQAVIYGDGAKNEEEWVSWYTMNGKSTTIQEILKEYGRDSFEDFMINDYGYGSKQEYADSYGIIYESESATFAMPSYSFIGKSRMALGNTYNDNYIRMVNNSNRAIINNENPDYYGIHPIIIISDMQIDGGNGYAPLVSKKYADDNSQPKINFSTNSSDFIETWASKDFYVKIQTSSPSGIEYFKWCSTTEQTCEPTTIQKGSQGQVLISTQSTSNIVCAIAYNYSGVASDKICSQKYKLYKKSYDAEQQPAKLSDIIKSEIKGISKSNNDYIRYEGSRNVVKNNFLWYGGQLWRILNLQNGKISLITNQPLTSISSNSTVWYNNKETYQKSYINNWLNTTFYNGLPQTMKDNIVPNKFCIDNMQLNYHTDCTLYTDSLNVGLLSYEDFYFLTSSSFLDISDNWWLGNTIKQTEVAYVSSANKVSNADVTTIIGVRPHLIINDITVTKGDGSMENPYRIKSETKNTDDVQIGEYISLPISGNACGDDNRCLFRVVSKDNDSVKVILNGLLSTTSKFRIDYDGGTSFSKEDIIYQNLLEFYNNIDNKYRYMNEKQFNIGSYDNGKDFLSVNNKTINSVVGLPTIGELFSGNDIDVSNYNSKVFVNIKTIENPAVSNSFWLMNNTVDTNGVFSMLNSGLLGGYDTTTAYGVRPVTFLNKGTSNDLTFTKGDGTAENPYWLGN